MNDTSYAIQHKTSKRYLFLPPRIGLHKETADEHAAFRWETMTEAGMEIIEHMGSFGSAFEVVPVAKVPPHHG